MDLSVMRMAHGKVAEMTHTFGTEVIWRKFFQYMQKIQLEHNYICMEIQHTGIQLNAFHHMLENIYRLINIISINECHDYE